MNKTYSPTQKALRRLLHDKTAMTGFVIVMLIIIVGIFSNQLAPYDHEQLDLTATFQPPSKEHLLGTDQLGRDLLSRIIIGTRITLLSGVVTVAIASLLGIPLGLISGYFGKRIDTLIVLILDVLLAFPTILLALLMVSILGPELKNALIAVGIASTPIFAKLARGSAISVKQNDYILAAISIGQPDKKIIIEHILPNSLAPLIVQATLRIGTAILTTATLSFLGLGAQPPTPEWGALVSEGRTFLQLAPYVSIFPGIAIMLCILGFSLFGDGLNDAFNPKISKNR